MKNWYYLQQLLMKKRNMRSKKLESTENKAEGYSTLHIGRVMEINMTNRLQNWSYLIQKR